MAGVGGEGGAVHSLSGGSKVCCVAQVRRLVPCEGEEGPDVDLCPEVGGGGVVKDHACMQSSVACVPLPLFSTAGLLACFHSQMHDLRFCRSAESVARASGPSPLSAC
jgi:hypothetical protein